MDVLPLSYNLTIKTSFPTGFSGVAEITISVPVATSKVTLNAAVSLRLLSAVAVQAGTRLGAVSSTYDAKTELTTLHFTGELQPGKAVLGLRWETDFDVGSMMGYYRVDCANSEGSSSQEYYAVTQMQPTMARRAFPCFDQPAKKATFTVSLIAPAGLTLLSNTPETSRSSLAGDFPTSSVLTSDFLRNLEGQLSKSIATTEDTRDWQLVSFEKTPIMSTYLVAWAVGTFSSIESSYTSPLTNKVVPLRLYASTSYQHVERGQGQLALDTLASVMPVYERLFDIPYELNKLDMLVCDAFDAGAMENWGLITAKTINILHDSDLSGAEAKQLVVATISHEAAHMWFGNLVSMAWWDDLWLNEGFATLMGEVVALNEIYPSWNVHSAFFKSHRTAALELDSLRHSHPVHMCCDGRSEGAVAQSFDAISYQKGSAILKMLCQVIGEETFLSGTSNYLKENKHGSTTSVDLWRALSAASGVDVALLMDSWVNKIGFPVVTVEETESSLKLRQNRFLSSGDPKPEEDVTLWTIPVAIKILGDQTPAGLVLMSDREVTIPKPAGTFILNSESSGTFRVSYPPSHLSKLATEAVSAEAKLTVADRLGLVQDAILLSEAGYTPTSSSLSLVQSFASETDYLVWAEIAELFKRLVDAWWEQPKEVLDGIKAFARSLFGPLTQRVGFAHLTEDSEDTKKLRVLALAVASAAEEPSAVNFMQQSFGLLASGQSDALLADLAPIIVSEAVKHGGAAEYNIALYIYSNPPTPQHQLAAVAGLTSTRDSELIQQTAAMLMSGQVAEQNVTAFLVGLASNPLSRRMVWQFVAGAWATLEVQFQGSFHLGKVAQYSFQSLSTLGDADAVEAFFADKDCTAFIQPLQQGLDTVRARARWLNRDAEDVTQWLKKAQFLQ